MATLTEQQRRLNEDLGQARRRIGELSDRVLVLENNLRNTQERIQADIKMLVDRVRKMG